MSTLHIPDELLKEAGLTEQELLVELACRLFDGGRRTLWSAAKLAGLDRGHGRRPARPRHLDLPAHAPRLGGRPQDAGRDGGLSRKKWLIAFRPRTWAR